jgi:DNA-binding protein YbaB
MCGAGGDSADNNFCTSRRAVVAARLHGWLTGEDIMTDRQVSHARAEFEALSAHYDRTLKQIRDMRDRMPAVKGTAQSANKLVRATVGAKGNLVKLEIEPKALRRLSSTELADLIVETAAAAARSALEEVQQILSPVMTVDAPMDKLMSGEADWAQHVRLNLDELVRGRRIRENGATSG